MNEKLHDEAEEIRAETAAAIADDHVDVGVAVESVQRVDDLGNGIDALHGSVTVSHCARASAFSARCRASSASAFSAIDRNL